MRRLIKRKASSFDVILEKVKKGKFNKENFISVYIGLIKSLCDMKENDYVGNDKIWHLFLQKSVSEEFELNTVSHNLDIDGESLNALTSQQKITLIDEAYTICEDKINSSVNEVINNRLDVSDDLEKTWEEQGMNINDVY